MSEIEDRKPSSISTLIGRTSLDRSTPPFVPWTRFSRAITYEITQDEKVPLRAHVYWTFTATAKVTHKATAAIHCSATCSGRAT